MSKRIDKLFDIPGTGVGKLVAVIKNDDDESSVYLLNIYPNTGSPIQISDIKNIENLRDIITDFIDEVNRVKLLQRVKNDSNLQR